MAAATMAYVYPKANFSTSSLYAAKLHKLGNIVALIFDGDVKFCLLMQVLRCDDVDLS